jgi:hypothetical protein
VTLLLGFAAAWNAIDILGDFGEACREEFRSLRVETA